MLDEQQVIGRDNEVSTSSQSSPCSIIQTPGQHAFHQVNMQQLQCSRLQQVCHQHYSYCTTPMQQPLHTYANVWELCKCPGLSVLLLQRPACSMCVVSHYHVDQGSNPQRRWAFRVAMGPAGTGVGTTCTQMREPS